MASKIVIFCFFLASLIGLNAGGELYVLHCPESLMLSEFEIEENGLEELYSAFLGTNVEKDQTEYGVHVVDPFKQAEAIVEVFVEGVASLGPSMEGKAKRISLQGDEEVSHDEPSSGIIYRIRQHATKGDIVHVMLSDHETPDYLFRLHEVLGAVPLVRDPAREFKHLQRAVDQDRQFLNELDALRSITAKVSGRGGVRVRADGRPDVYQLRVRALHALTDMRGPRSEQAQEAVALLVDSLVELKDAFVGAYGGAAVVCALAGEAAAAHVRGDADTRHGLRAFDAPAALLKLNGSEQSKYDRMAMMHIVLWFGSALAVGITGAVLVFMDMDPGRDTIIYRKTAAAMRSNTF